MAQVKKYKAEVVSILNPIDNIFTVEFISHSGQFKYAPGQFLHLALEEYEPSNGWPESRCFSMHSAPFCNTLKLTFVIKGEFTKRIAKELTIGCMVNIKLPYGELFQHDHSKQDVIFIAGGTGITPFLSAFNDPSFAEYLNPILYLGIRNKGFNIYNDEINLATKINPTLKVIIKYQDVEGILDTDAIFNENKITSTYFISGPQAMISAFKLKLIGFGIKDYFIKTDEWE